MRGRLLCRLEHYNFLWILIKFGHSLSFDQNVRGRLLYHLEHYHLMIKMCAVAYFAAWNTTTLNKISGYTQKRMQKFCHDMTEHMCLYDIVLNIYIFIYRPMTQLSLSFDQNLRGRLLCRLEHYHFEQNTALELKKSCKSHVMI